jgi:hypothetical protein
MNQPETLLENRVLSIEARVVALEKSIADLPEKSQQAKSFARDVSASNLNFRMELLSLIEDHIEVLKLVHTMVGPTDRSKKNGPQLHPPRRKQIGPVPGAVHAIGRHPQTPRTWRPAKARRATFKIAWGITAQTVKPESTAAFALLVKSVKAKADGCRKRYAVQRSRS